MKVLELSQFSQFLQARPRNFHKGDAGHVLVVGGNAGFSGAARLAGEAALRVGAGLVSVATCAEHAAFLNLCCPELMCHKIVNAIELTPLLLKADVVILGPGLGQDDWAQSLFEVISHSEKKMVVDADALNLLAINPMKKSNWILTPHPGEASRLLKLTTMDIQKDREFAIKKMQETYGGVSVLKGAGSLVLGDDGVIAICEAGNPGMATAGMGDVLSGVVGGLLAQKVSLIEAAKLGVLVHALAGDLAAKNGERGTIASDLMNYLHKLVN